MSITTVDRSKSLSSPVVYAVYGDRAGAKAGKVRAAEVTVVCGSDLGEIGYDGRWSGVSFIESGRAIMNVYSTRSNKAITLVQSWSQDELDRENPVHVRKANAMGVELARRLAPDTPVVVATHTDSEGGCVHNHLVLLNHDVATGKAAPKRAGNWHAVKAVNDDVMRDWGMRVLEPEGFVKLRRAERAALREGKTIDSTGLTVDTLTGETWADFLRKRVDELIADQRVVSAPNGLEEACKIAGEFNVSIDVHDSELSIGLVDDTGEDAVYRTRTPRGKSRTRKAADAGSKFGSGYTADGLRDRIAEAQAQRAASRARQQRINRLKKLKEESEKSNDPTINRPATGGGGKLRGPESGPRVRHSGDHAEHIDGDRRKINSGDETNRRVAEPNPAHRSIGAGTNHVIRAAGEARRAATAFGTDHGRDGGVRPGSKGRRGDHQQFANTNYDHGSRVEQYQGYARPTRGYVQSHTGDKPASSEAQRREREQRVTRLVQADTGEPEF